MNSILSIELWWKHGKYRVVMKTGCCHDMEKLKPMTLCYISRALDHWNILETWRGTPENTIKQGTRHYFEPNRFNTNLKPPSHPCIFCPHNKSLSSSFSLCHILVPISSLFSTIPNSLNRFLPLSSSFYLLTFPSLHTNILWTSFLSSYGHC